MKYKRTSGIITSTTNTRDYRKMAPRQRRDPLATTRVLGDVVDSFDNSVPLTLSYNNTTVVNGGDFRPSAVSNRPMVRIGEVGFSSLYTLVMVDPDAPTPTNPTLKEYLHWMVTDIPGTRTANCGTEILPYESPRPTVGIHRIVFVLFRQPLTNMSRAVTNLSRQNFNTRQFAESYCLGSPVAVVHLNCQRENGTGGRRFS